MALPLAGFLGVNKHTIICNKYINTLIIIPFKNLFTRHCMYRSIQQWLRNVLASGQLPRAPVSEGHHCQTILLSVEMIPLHNEHWSRGGLSIPILIQFISSLPFLNYWKKVWSHKFAKGIKNLAILLPNNIPHKSFLHDILQYSRL